MLLTSPFISTSPITSVSEESPFTETPVFEQAINVFSENTEESLPIFEPIISNSSYNNFDSVFAEEEDPTVQNTTSVSGDPREIIRERLKEILKKKDTSDESVSTEKNIPEVQEEKHSPSDIALVQRIHEPNRSEEIFIEQEKITFVPANEKANLLEETITTFGDQIVDSLSENRKEEEAISSEINIKDEAAIEISGIDPEKIIQRIAKETENRNDEVDRGELEYALESTIIYSLENLPLLDESKTEKSQPPIADSKIPMNFFDWLKHKHVGEFGKIEEVHAYDNSPELILDEPIIGVQNLAEINSKSEDENEVTKTVSGSVKIAEVETLIDKFIATEPRIVASKTEFYSPAKQAQKSLIEHEDLVSETLARIYKHQGALLKARSAYQKLMLLHPEKKAYFAALIEEIDNSFNNPDKQDL